jgi:hypothetical protein
LSLRGSALRRALLIFFNVLALRESSPPSFRETKRCKARALLAVALRQCGPQQRLRRSKALLERQRAMCGTECAINAGTPTACLSALFVSCLHRSERSMRFGRPRSQTWRIAASFREEARILDEITRTAHHSTLGKQAKSPSDWVLGATFGCCEVRHSPRLLWRATVFAVRAGRHPSDGSSPQRHEQSATRRAR